MNHTPESTTHWACQKRLDKDGGESKCCSCVPHKDCDLSRIVPDESMIITAKIGTV